MFSTLLERMGSASRGGVCPDIARASPSDSINSIETGGTFSNALIASSTPPTSIGDSVSISSVSLSSEKEIAHPIATENPSGRSRRARTSVGTYNVKALAGTSIHAPRKYGKDASISELETRRRTISGDTLAKALASGNSSTPNVNKDNAKAVREGIDGLDLDWSIKPLPRSKSEIGLNALAKKKAAAEAEELARRKSTRLAGEKVESLTKKLTVLGKRGRKNFEDGLSKASRELKKLADTKEFAHIDTQPVLHEVWSNGKLVVPEEQQRKKKKVEPPAQLLNPKKLPEEPKPEEKKKPSGRREKVWLTKGLYAGQEQKDADWSSGFSDKEKESMANRAPTKPRRILPMPIWHGKRLLESDRDFKLPFDVFSPLPPGQPKPDDWKNSTKNRFIGDAASEWKHTKHFGDFDSRCVCTPAEGCGDYCQNRIMFYECDDENCGAGRACGNRAFADLQQRRKHGNKYDIGVEVVKTADRGYGVRSNRCFNDDQIIVEYNGEIITEEECDRRMNEVYKNNECYYLMAFDQNMIIDATTGSIARFINHSCTPNCKMVKWIVAGKPRMALFADRDIMTGEELTYDYNFDPFSAKNVQECRCGSANCRGFLGPRPKDVKPPKENAIKEAVKAGVKAGKRKLKELLGGEEDDIKSRSPKKRKIKPATGIKRAASSASMKMATNAKGAAKVLKKSVSEQLLNARHAVTPKRSISVKSKKASILKSYGKGQTKLASRNSTLALVAGSPESKKSPRPKAAYVRRKSVAKNVVRSVNGATGAAEQGLSIKVVSAAGEAEDDAEDDVEERVRIPEEVEILEAVKEAT